MKILLKKNNGLVNLVVGNSSEMLPNNLMPLYDSLLRAKRRKVWLGILLFILTIVGLDVLPTDPRLDTMLIFTFIISIVTIVAGLGSSIKIGKVDKGITFLDSITKDNQNRLFSLVMKSGVIDPDEPIFGPSETPKWKRYLYLYTKWSLIIGIFSMLIIVILLWARV